MKVRKFTGPTMAAAVDAMKRELGADAIVLATSRVPQGGLFSLLGKTMVEVTGAVDDPLPAPGAGLPRPSEGEPFDETLRQLRRLNDKFQARRDGGHQSRPVPRETVLYEGLRSEIEGLKAAVLGIGEYLKYAKMPALPDTLREAYLRLCEQDVNQNTASDIVQSVYAQLTPDRMTDRQAVDELVCSALSSLVRSAPSGTRRRRKTMVLALVGPTGVGKTTTLAKLAAVAKLGHRQEVGIISADTYRIGAVEQLRTFAAIADIPMSVAYKPADITAALRTFREKDIVLVDTVGRSQRAAADLKALGRLLVAANPDEVHLVLSAATSSSTAMDMAEKFAVLNPNRLILTKLDEAVSLGHMLDVVTRHKIPVSYATDGQTVPDDIRQVDPSWFASRVYAGGLAHA